MPIPVKIVTVTLGGVTYEGIYYVEGSVVYVESPFGKKTAEVSRSREQPEMIAKLLLSKLVGSSASTD
jgi:non-canonical (house-cleaning) NTP pyrophosphatase